MTTRKIGDQPRKQVEIDEGPFTGVKGCEGLRRAVVVAIAGDHALIYYTYPGFPDSQLIAALPSGSRAILRCPCGYLGDRERECKCSLTAVERHRAKAWKRSTATIHAEAVPFPSYYDRDRATYPWGDSLAYIERAAKLPTPTDLDKRTDAEMLLAVATTRLDLGDKQRVDILAVAGTIARLGESVTIHAAHLAEALQMRIPEQRG